MALDIRNFQYQSPPSNVYYNGVTSGMNANTIKDIEAGWVAAGYPGPDFPPVTLPPDPNDQVGIIDGNTSGIIIDEIDARYAPGDEILAAVYSGTVQSIPDFAYTVATTATINTNQNRDNAISMSVTKNASFTGVVATSAFPDWGDAGHPWGTTLAPLTFTPSPMTPNGSVVWSTFQTSGAPQGVYTVWIQGHSSDPVLLDHYYPVGIAIGSVNRDFSTSSGATVSLATTGSTGTAPVTVSTTNNNGTFFGGDVTPERRGWCGRQRRPALRHRHGQRQPIDRHAQQGHQPERHGLGQRRDARTGRVLPDAAGDRHELGRAARDAPGADHADDRDGQQLQRIRRHPRLCDVPDHRDG